VYGQQLLRRGPAPREAGVTDFSPYNLTDGDPAPMSARLFDPEFEREV